MEVLAVHDRLTLCVTITAPVPESVIVAGDPVALLVTVTLPLTLPVTAGLKSTLKVRLWPAFKVVGTLKPLVAKPAPVTVAVEIWSSDPPLLVRV